MFVKYIEETGEIVGVGAREDANYRCLEVDIEEVIDIIEGREPRRNYKVQYNPKKKSLELVNVTEYTFDSSDINDFIYEIPEKQVTDPDILVEHDLKNRCWRIIAGKELTKSVKSKGLKLNNKLFFSITAKHDPNIVYKTFSIDFSAISKKHYEILDFTMPFEDTDASISIFTRKIFDSYQFKRIVNE